VASRNNQFLMLEIKGAKELEAALNGLGQDRLIKSTSKRALLRVARPMAVTAQRNAPTHTGRMATKIAASTTLSRRQRRGGGYRTDANTAHVFVGTGPRGPGVLAEFGTGPRYTKKPRKFVGAMPAQPFMRPAWEQHKRQILDDYSGELWIQIEKSAKRLARRSLKAASAR
jgi:HK97 gp10 family phage protein